MTMLSSHSHGGAGSQLPTNHISDELLTAYAAGTLSEAESLIVATHAAFCPLCRDAIAEFEAIGATFMNDLEPEEMTVGSLDFVMSKLDDDEAWPENVVQHPNAQTKSEKPDSDVILPEPLRSYVGGDLKDVVWRPVIRGLEEAELSVSSPDYNVRLIRVAAGAAMPQHSHQGTEYTLLLTGAYRDSSGRFARGDVQIADGDVDHQPTAEPGEPCVCLIVTDAPIKLTGPLGRLLNPFISY